MHQNRLFLPLGLVLFFSSLGLGVFFVLQGGDFFSKKSKEVTKEQASHGSAPLWDRVVDRIAKGETLSDAFGRLGFSAQEISEMAASLRAELNLRTIHVGDAVIVERQTKLAQAQPALLAVEIVRQEAYGLPVRYRLSKNKSGDFDLVRIEQAVAERKTTIAGRIVTSLYDGIIQAGGDSTLVNRFSDLFGWQVDFYRQAQKGDEFKLIVEGRYADGRLVGYGRVLAAEYNNSGRLFRGFRFEDKDDRVDGVFDEQGESIEKGFLKSPMMVSRITSRYGQRFHPVLRRHKKHNGVDYGARTGTPFWSVADGTVLEARYSPTAGKMLRIRHRGGYVTEYFHCSRFASGIRPGVKVKQKQVIGYVGTTGRSTGPHLHFGMMLNKHYVNPSKQRFPPGKPLPRGLVAQYQEYIKPLLDELSKIKVS